MLIDPIFTHLCSKLVSIQTVFLSRLALVHFTFHGYLFTQQIFVCFIYKQFSNSLFSFCFCFLKCNPINIESIFMSVDDVINV